MESKVEVTLSGVGAKRLVEREHIDRVVEILRPFSHHFSTNEPVVFRCRSEAGEHFIEASWSPRECYVAGVGDGHSRAGVQAALESFQRDAAAKLALFEAAR